MRWLVLVKSKTEAMGYLTSIAVIYNMINKLTDLHDNILQQFLKEQSRAMWGLENISQYCTLFGCGLSVM